MCTHRPSLSPKGEISRNIVGVMEIAPNKVKHFDALRLHRKEGPKDLLWSRVTLKLILTNKTISFK